MWLTASDLVGLEMTAGQGNMLLTMHVAVLFGVLYVMVRIIQDLDHTDGD